MSASGALGWDEDVLRGWLGKVSEAAVAFERRWTWRALQRVDGGIHRRLFEQRGLFDQAAVTGTVDEIAVQGGALCRGYQVAVRTMEGAAEPDDAYQLGFDARTGCRVAVGACAASADRVAEISGNRVVFLTPDEVATMFSALEGFKTIEAVKQHFPGAELVDVHRDQPAKGDSFGGRAA